MPDPADYVVRSEQAMRWLELAVAYFLVALFAIGAFDMGLTLYELLLSGRFTDPDQVIDLIDTVLVLLIIVEVYQTVIAFSRDEPVVRIVINAALIAIARKVISFRPHQYADMDTALVAAATFAVLLAVLIAAFYVIRTVPVEPDNPMRRRETGDSPPTEGQ
ncbi:MAG: phosphate-starvation-inducible PsiE family protein [Haloferacaceae archaeon]